MKDSRGGTGREAAVRGLSIVDSARCCVAVQASLFVDRKRASPWLACYLLPTRELCPEGGSSHSSTAATE